MISGHAELQQKLCTSLPEILENWYALADSVSPTMYSDEESLLILAPAEQTQDSLLASFSVNGLNACV
ncbi:hypothetical protein DPMN_005436 [Dreissena polymorpha]|uniref:Uncharacterized protein n=1 Tax=Dreissena polymorpha TaxID=45954 RepID=A0A9D4MQC9_DREPO|nr:hypothetical protein DPMN_005436 [Dreissena polymorpha]